MSHEDEPMLPLDDDRSETATPKKRATKKTARKSAKKASRKKAGAEAGGSPEERPAPEASSAESGQAGRDRATFDDEVTFAPGIVVDEDDKRAQRPDRAAAEHPRGGASSGGSDQPGHSAPGQSQPSGQPQEPRPFKKPHHPKDRSHHDRQQKDRQQGDRSQGDRSQGDRPHNDPQQGGGNGFKKNKRKRNKNKRWPNKTPRGSEEDSPIEFGELFEWELLDDLSALKELAASLKSGDSAPFDYDRIYNMGLTELRGEAAALEVKTPHHAPNREQLINAITEQAAAGKSPVMATGILDCLDDEAGGVLVYERDNYRIKALSAYLPQSLIDNYGLQRGHIIKAQLHPRREGESCPFVVAIESVMDRDPETLSEIVPFTERVPYYPTQRMLLESESEGKWDNLSMRVVDCLTPIGLGQRGLIVAPPRTGKTVIMQGMANAIQKNYPDAHLIILLIDERPEEVTDFRRQVKGEVISSTFDESAESHVHAAEMVIEKARRMVEIGKDVVILLDSITRLARAYNTTMPSSGKILSGGVEANALQKPKRFFGSARNIEDGGSLTILATALVETGSKMDEVIFEEFKGTGNMELHLDRGLSDKRIFPALSMDKSGTRKEELLYHPDEMLKIYSLRRAMKGLPSTDAMEMLIQRIKKTNTNAEFLMSVAR
jgi:transcription termination factor Rho